jgi:hypothetical protein
MQLGRDAADQASTMGMSGTDALASKNREREFWLLQIVYHLADET